MPLEQKLSTCVTADCTKLNLVDTTGIYNATSNPGGWNMLVNVDPNSVVSAIITIQKGTGTIYTFDVTSIINAVLLPNQFVLNYEFPILTINPTDIGQLNKISDGIYNITYTIDGETKTYQVLFTCNTQCCVDKLLNSAIGEYLCGENCTTSESIQSALKARALLLQATKWAFGCGQITKAQQLLNAANKICNTNATSNCGCGCN